jgi:hypothetical protein
MAMAKYLAVLFILAVLGFVCPGQASLPNTYYVNTTWSDHSLQGLKTLVEGKFNIAYKSDVFDCSEMSAYLEWLLQCNGFEASFCMDGTGPWAVSKDTGYKSHMWVMVELHNEGRVYIEPTAIPIKVIALGDPDWDKYDRPPEDMFLGMKNFLSIYDAVNGTTPNPNDSDSVYAPEYELDWWNWWDIGNISIIPVPVDRTMPFKGITVDDIQRFKESVATIKPVQGVIFRTTVPKKDVVFKTV